MKEYFVSQWQMYDIFGACQHAAELYEENSADPSRWYKLRLELQKQATATAHERIDDIVIGKIKTELFKLGKYMNLLESTFDFYVAKDSKEMLGNIWRCRENICNLIDPSRPRTFEPD